MSTCEEELRCTACGHSWFVGYQRNGSLMSNNPPCPECNAKYPKVRPTGTKRRG